MLLAHTRTADTSRHRLTTASTATTATTAVTNDVVRSFGEGRAPDMEIPLGEQRFKCMCMEHGTHGGVEGSVHTGDDLSSSWSTSSKLARHYTANLRSRISGRHSRHETKSRRAAQGRDGPGKTAGWVGTSRTRPSHAELFGSCYIRCVPDGPSLMSSIN